MSCTGEKLPVAGITSAQPQAHPTYHDDRRVTFVFDAPDANSVQVQIHGEATDLEGDIIDLSRNEDGKWTATVGPLRGGFHYYNMIVDGARCVDQHAEVCWGWGRVMNHLEVPDPEFDFFLPRDVPHGEVRLHYYKSEMTGCLRRAIVYTPPGYDGGEERYPVFYLQHGSGESERGWTWHAKANFVLDSFIADGRCVPMIMVNDHGYAVRGGMKAPFTEERSENVFTELVPRELVPQIDTSYRTLPERKHRAMGGLSMGSGQALAIGLAHLDTFANVLALSGGLRNFDPETAYGAVFQDPQALNEKLDLFWFGAGYEEGAAERGKALEEALGELGVNYVWCPVVGAHDWNTWRRHLADILPRLFRG